MRHEHKKLIRDRIPEIIAADGRHYRVRQLSGDDFLRELSRKLGEEASEIQEALTCGDRQEVVTELADLLEVIEAITATHGLSAAEVIRTQANRRQERGGFEKRLFLEWTEEPESSGISFADLTVGEQYTRPELAQRWRYAGYQALARGVVTPAGSPHIILFVTKEKQSLQTQYRDSLEDGRLFWEGESGHQNDRRIVDAANKGEQIHLFYRDIHHTPFTYYGRINLLTYQLKSEQPSSFVFELRNH